jgi:oligogalacturonide lyase
MSVGKKYPCEWSFYNDSETGVEIKQLTQCHSEHLYFNRSGWYDNNSKLIYRSLRSGLENLFSMDLATGESIQLTDFKDYPVWGDSTCINSTGSQAYFISNRAVHSLDMTTLESREIYHITEGFSTDELVCAPDGKSIYFPIVTDKFNQYDIFRQGSCAYNYREEMNKFNEQDIYSKIVRLDTRSGESEIIYEDAVWVAHLAFSPANSNLFSFCHQGKTMKHRNRIWAMYLDEKKPWAVAPTYHDVLGITHEQWLADGIHIAYQAKGKLNGREMFHGIVRFDNQYKFECRVPIYSTHHSCHCKEYFIGDGNFTDQQYLYLFKVNKNGYDEPEKICFHGSTVTHVHPAYSPHGNNLLFSSDRDGKSVMYMINLADVL